ncbi:hypothetical protein KY284_027168 [Solanum tuberosum]|nr:hypothetical protein KY284_027168 [Solanum tuberosum]
MHQAEQDRRLVHFLMGLNEMYTVVRGSILMMSTLPSMAQVFAILSQEERQREVRPHNHTVLESTSLNASVSSNVVEGSKGFRTSYTSSKGGASSSNPNTNTVFRGNSSTSNRSNLFCDFCKRTGHTKDRCYKLHGYPSNSRPSKGRSSGSTANVYSSEEDMNRNEVPDESRKQMPAGNGTDGSGDMLNGAVNLADSGASHHMTYTKNALTNLKTLPYPSLITLPNGYKVKVTEIGDGPSLKSPLALGRARNGLYFFCPKCHSCGPTSRGLSHVICCSTDCFSTYQHVPSSVQNKRVLTGTECQTSAPSNVKCSHVSNKEVCTVGFPSRLGHVPFVKMRGISTIPIQFSNKQPFTCAICPMARQTRMPFPDSTTTTTKMIIAGLLGHNYLGVKAMHYKL